LSFQDEFTQMRNLSRASIEEREIPRFACLRQAARNDEFNLLFCAIRLA